MKQKKELSVRDLLKITRGFICENPLNKKTSYDQNREEEKFRSFFSKLNVAIIFIDLEIYDNFVFWGGTIDGMLQFVYKVTNDEQTSGVEFNYLADFNTNSDENIMIVEMVESYYDTFYKYWRDNILTNN